MKSIEEYLEMMEYLSVEEVEQPKWKLEDLQTKIHPSLDENNFLSYLFYLQLRPDLNDDEKDTLTKLMKLKIALNNREINKQYKHFEEANYN